MDAAVKDERSTRRWRATIDLNQGRARVRELPSDPRGAPAEATATPRAAPPREGPLRPWSREEPPPPAVHVTPQAAGPVGPGATQVTGPFGSPQTLDTPPVQPQEDAGLVEQITERVVERIRGAFGLPIEEPPVPLLHNEANLSGFHAAGGFMHELPEAPASPAGAFVDAESETTAAPHPAGAFTSE
jgi:hypothetical protein